MAAAFKIISFSLVSQLVHCMQPIYTIHDQVVQSYELPNLPFQYHELEPYINSETVTVHHLGHHAAYTKKLNVALERWRQENSSYPSGESIQTILKAIHSVPEKYKANIVNNGGGYVNHNLYWWVMSPNPTGEERLPSSPLLEDIQKNFGSFEVIKEAFTQKALDLFGSGYIWLSRQPTNGMLVISTTANQDSPLSQGLHPILVIDVWEHAYYLKHKNKRPDYISDWWKLVDWQKVDELDSWYTDNETRDEL